MVDTSLARQVVRFAAGGDGIPDLGVELDALCSEMREHVERYTGLRAAGAVPHAETVSRAQWAEVNLQTLAQLLDPVGERLEGRISAAAGPLAGALRLGARATLAAEAGLVLGYASQRVLGQYELSLIQPEAPPRLLFIALNLEEAVKRLGVERASFLAWIAAHEVTHVLQFQGVAWLRGHLSSLLREYLRTVEVRIEHGNAGGLPSLPAPSRLVELFREGGLVAMVQTREQRTLMDRIQAAMALIEGYSEHVMDAVGEAHLAGYRELRDAMDRRRRSRSAPERLIARLLGLDLKLRQYELGHAFCDRVAGAAGIDGLNTAWSGPAALPTLEELSDPESWIARANVEAAPAA